MVTQDMKTVFMGTPDFAVPPLKALVEAGYEVAAVVTQPDKPKGRGKTLMPTPVKEEALMHEIPVYQPKRVRNNEEFLETLKEINPEILETSGEQTGDEGCLSVPGMAGQVTRPNYVKVKALDEDMNEVEYEGEGLLARAFCHELDHLDGHMYTELVEGELHHVSYDDDEE